MLTAESKGGMVVSPHGLASSAGQEILEKGGNAVEAAVATAAALCVCYPHMTGLGGDGFWLVLKAGEKKPVFIDACGRAAQKASLGWYAQKGLSQPPKRGPLAAMTVAGAVSGWQAALGLFDAPGASPSRMPLDALLGRAVALAENGYPVSASQHGMTKMFLEELQTQPGFAGQFLKNGAPPEKGSLFTLPALAKTLRRLAGEGLDSFYRGALAKDMAGELEAAGSPLGLDDFKAHAAEIREPLNLRLEKADLFNSPAPTQGVASLMILGIFERLIKSKPEILDNETLFVHAIVEATKQAFKLRDKHVADPAHMARPCGDFLEGSLLDKLAGAVSMKKALPWPPGQAGGDTVWMGAVDRYGNAVSYIQSVYHEFGSGLVLPATGVTWQNRGLGFSFEKNSANCLAPGKKPFHTLNPAMAVTDDGRIVPYGTMGGEGQPQTQAAVFARYYYQGKTLHQAIDEPRWLLGRTWGDQNAASLKLENRFSKPFGEALEALGHKIELLPAYASVMGHAGILCRAPDGTVRGASDPRSDGRAAGE